MWVLEREESEIERQREIEIKKGNKKLGNGERGRAKSVLTGPEDMTHLDIRQKPLEAPDIIFDFESLA